MLAASADFWRRCWNRNARRQQHDVIPFKSSIPSGRRVYAVGDIHGRDDLFADLLKQIACDGAQRGAIPTTLILLGDLIDRGPSSRQVIERVLALQRGPLDVRLLSGNHEDIFLQAIGGDAAILRHHTRIGGDATIKSYGVTDDQYRTMSFAAIAELLPALVPAAHRAILASAVTKIVIGDYAFVHAGIRPGIPLDDQTDGDLRWIRTAFTASTDDHGMVIVHGHSICALPQNLYNRIGIDTGGYRTGVLTAVGLEENQRWFLSTASPAVHPSRPEAAGLAQRRAHGR